MRLPIVEHQNVALRQAMEGLEAARPGLMREFASAHAHDPTLRRVVAKSQGPDLAGHILAALDRERQAQRDPSIKAERLAARWKKLEQDHDKLNPWERYLEQKDQWAALEARIIEITSEIGQDPQMDAVLWARRKEFGIGERRPLGEALRNSAAVVALEGEPKLRPSPAPGLSR
jgi:hypothetical protein